MRREILEEVKNWLGTPFKHQGRIKRVGCDCIGLIFGVMENLNIKINGKDPKNFDINSYSRIPDGDLLKQKLDEVFNEAKLVEAGDIILMKFRKHPQHVAFISNIKEGKIYITHAYQQSKGVKEHILSDNWKKRIVKIYNIESAITK